MRDADKDRDQDKAAKRAVADCRCALRKLGMLDQLRAYAALATKGCEDESEDYALTKAGLDLANDLAGALLDP
jgi:hypothetical protein